MRKALAADADAVILDLEDSVAVERKDVARRTITGLLEDVDIATSLSSAGTPEIHVRVNRSGDAYDVADLHVAASPLVRAVRLPKAESAAMVRSASQVLSDLERDTDLPEGGIGLYPTIESARGVLECREIAAADSRVVRLVIGQADLVADLDRGAGEGCGHHVDVRGSRRDVDGVVGDGGREGWGECHRRLLEALGLGVVHLAAIGEGDLGVNLCGEELEDRGGNGCQRAIETAGRAYPGLEPGNGDEDARSGS